MVLPRVMDLTPELVRRIHRDEPELGPLPWMTPMTDADFEDLADRLLERLAPGADLRLFAYGSLLWRPACAHEGQARARVRGWHRSFCFRTYRYRATPERPGLMLVLDRGGSCAGVVQRFAHARARERLNQILRRELSVREAPHRPRWLNVEAEDGTRVRAIAFVADRRSALYCGRQPLGATVEALATAIGHVGSMAEYLMKTVEHLEALGIHDPYLWRLQGLVAERIIAETGGGASP